MRRELTTPPGGRASGWGREASPRPIGQELKWKTRKLSHGPRHLGEWGRASVSPRSRPSADRWAHMAPYSGPTGGRREAHGEGGAQSPAWPQKASVQALPVLSLLLLRGVHELICWQLQDKRLFHCKLKDLEEKRNKAITRAPALCSGGRPSQELGSGGLCGAHRQLPAHVSARERWRATRTSGPWL